MNHPRERQETRRSNPRISVNVPTKNSAATLERCLQCVLEQGIEVEIIVADDCSADGTQEIARSFGARLLHGPLSLLEARFQAFLTSTTDVVLLLDSDQYLHRDVLPRCLKLLASHDCLVLEETSYDAQRWLSRLFEADRRFLNQLRERHLNPEGGSMLPRVFRREVLANAFLAIPDGVRKTAIVQDHAIIYQAASPWISSVGIVPHAVEHQEMERLSEMWRKYFAWGKNLADIFTVSPQSRTLTEAALRTRLRKGDASMRDFAMSMLLIALKSAPYSAGYLFRRLERALKRGPR